MREPRLTPEDEKYIADVRRHLEWFADDDAQDAQDVADHAASTPAPPVRIPPDPSRSELARRRRPWLR